MISRHQQLNRHDPDNGVYGDCFRTVIACLLNVWPQDVPHVCDGPTEPGEADRAMKAWLKTKGHVLIGVRWNGEVTLEEVLEVGGALSEGCHWLLSGTSRNGCNHVVICKGNAIVHDTSIDQSGIVGPCSDDLWTIEWLVRPAECDLDDLDEVAA